MQIRPLEPSDVADVAALFCRVFRAKGRANPQAVAAHLRDVYLENPWHDPDDPSFVLEEGGAVAGFLGSLPLPMRFDGHPIRAAVGGNLMVDPSVKNPFAGAQLIKRFLEGDHDLSMTDTSNVAGRRTWESRGAATLHQYSLQWVRVLRPASFALSVASRARAFRLVTKLGRQFARMADHALSKREQSPFRFEPAGLDERPLTPDILVEGFTELTRHQRLVPAHSAESLTWLLAMAAAKREFGGRLVGKGLYHRSVLVGWYLYYPNSGGWAQTLQVMARPAHVRSVLMHLFADAWREGSTAVIGRVHPILMNELPGLQCLFMNRTTWVQCHTRDESLLDAFHRGEALVTRLEGEWWTRFQNDAFDEADVAAGPRCVTQPTRVEAVALVSS